MTAFPAWHRYDQTTVCLHAALVRSRKAVMHSVLEVCSFTHLLWIQRFKKWQQDKSTGATMTREECVQKQRWKIVGGRFGVLFLFMFLVLYCATSLQNHLIFFSCTTVSPKFFRISCNSTKIWTQPAHFICHTCNALNESRGTGHYHWA